MRVGDWVSKTLVFIGREYGGQFLVEGTAFITATLVSAYQGWQTIVTAKHVIEPSLDNDRICARLNGRDGKARLLPLP